MHVSLPYMQVGDSRGGDNASHVKSFMTRLFNVLVHLEGSKILQRRYMLSMVSFPESCLTPLPFPVSQLCYVC